jgi:poly(3-hydroxybutyrate) depolymerase
MSTMNRRAILAGTAALPTIAIATAAQCVLAPDPVFAVIEAHKAAQAAFVAAIDAAGPHDDPPASFSHAEADAARTMILTVPTTLPGLAALVAHIHHCEDTGCEIHNLNMRDGNEYGTGSITLLQTIDTALASLVRS